VVKKMKFFTTTNVILAVLALSMISINLVESFKLSDNDIKKAKEMHPRFMQTNLRTKVETKAKAKNSELVPVDQQVVQVAHQYLQKKQIVYVSQDQEALMDNLQVV